jgi:hypothetical protein
LNGITSVPNFVKIYKAVQKLLLGDRQTGDLIRLLSFSENGLKQCICVCVGGVKGWNRRRADGLKSKKLPVRYNSNTLPTSTTLICVLSPEVRRCHVLQIQERFTRNRNVERYFVIGYFRLVLGQGWPDFWTQ